jgi:hypothetical protein
MKSVVEGGRNVLHPFTSSSSSYWINHWC